MCIVRTKSEWKGTRPVWTTCESKQVNRAIGSSSGVRPLSLCTFTSSYRNPRLNWSNSSYNHSNCMTAVSIPCAVPCAVTIRLWLPLYHAVTYSQNQRPSKQKKKKKVKAERHGLLYPRSSSSYVFETPNKSQCNIDVFQNEFPDEMRLMDHSSCLKLPGCLLPTACPLSDLATQRWWLRSVTSHSSIEAQAQPWFVHIGR